MGESIEVEMPKEVLEKLGWKPGHKVHAVKKVNVEYVFIEETE